MVVAKEELDTLLNHEGTQSLFLDTFSTQFSLSGYKNQKKQYITDADCVCITCLKCLNYEASYLNPS